MTYTLRHRLSVLLATAALVLGGMFVLHETDRIGDLGLSEDAWDWIAVGVFVLGSAGFTLPSALDTPGKRQTEVRRLAATLVASAQEPRSAPVKTGSGALVPPAPRLRVQPPRADQPPYPIDDHRE